MRQIKIGVIEDRSMYCSPRLLAFAVFLEPSASYSVNSIEKVTNLQTIEITVFCVQVLKRFKEKEREKQRLNDREKRARLQALKSDNIAEYRKHIRE